MAENELIDISDIYGKKPPNKVDVSDIYGSAPSADTNESSDMLDKMTANWAASHPQPKKETLPQAAMSGGEHLALSFASGTLKSSAAALNAVRGMATFAGGLVGADTKSKEWQDTKTGYKPSSNIMDFVNSIANITAYSKPFTELAQRIDKYNEKIGASKWTTIPGTVAAELPEGVLEFAGNTPFAAIKGYETAIEQGATPGRATWEAAKAGVIRTLLGFGLDKLGKYNNILVRRGGAAGLLGGAAAIQGESAEEILINMGVGAITAGKTGKIETERNLKARSVESLKGPKAKGAKPEAAKPEAAKPTEEENQWQQVLQEMSDRQQEFENTYGRQMDDAEMHREAARIDRENADTRPTLEQLYERLGSGDKTAADEISSGNYRGSETPFFQPPEPDGFTIGLPQRDTAITDKIESQALKAAAERGSQILEGREKPRIVSPAIKMKDGTVITPSETELGKTSHDDIIKENPEAKKGVRGFVDNTGAFQNRIQGAKTAKAAGQADEKVNVLHSEDLKSPPPAEAPAQQPAKSASETLADRVAREKQQRMKGTVLVPTKEDIGKAVKYMGDIAGKLKMGVLKAEQVTGLEPFKIVEEKFGADVPVQIFKGTEGNTRYQRRVLMDTYLDKLDNTFEGVRKWFGFFSPQERTAFTLTHKAATSEEGRAVQKEMENWLPKEFKDPSVREGYNQITQSNHKYGDGVLKKYEGRELAAVAGYTRDVYDTDTAGAKRFAKTWMSTDSWSKHKTFPTPADAKGIQNLDLRYPDPMDNAMSERMAIANLEGKYWLLNEALTTGGKGVYIDDSAEAIGDEIASTTDALKNPETLSNLGFESKDAAENHIANLQDKLDRTSGWVDGGDIDPVFDGYSLDPDYAKAIKNLTSFNAVMQSPIKPFRDIANVSRGWRLVVPFFHNLNTVKAQANDLISLGIQTKGKEVGLSMRRAAEAAGKDIGMTTANKDYGEYLQLSGGHEMSLETESQQLFQRGMDWFEKQTGLPIYGKTLGPYTNWLFNEYIPQVKWMSYILHVAKLEGKLGRELTRVEKTNIIKETQNIYGEMNESLFGRSGTMTSALRLIFTAPGYGEGNFRTIYDSAAHWGNERGTRARYFIPTSLITAGIVASIGTRLLTGQWPDMPQKLEDLRDLWKIKTTFKDQQDRPIYVDALTYERDYWSVYGNLFTGQPERIPEDVMKRVGGMTNSLFNTAMDLADIARGRSLYDWKGNRVVPVYDTFCQKAMDLAVYEIREQAPITFNIYQQSKIKDASKAVSAVESLLGFREAYSEEDKRTMENINKLFNLHDDRERQFYALAKDPHPIETLQKYNEKVEDVLKIMPEDLQNEWRKKLIINIDEYQKNLIKEEKSKKRTPYQKQRAQRILENIGKENE